MMMMTIPLILMLFSKKGFFIFNSYVYSDMLYLFILGVSFFIFILLYSMNFIEIYKDKLFFSKLIYFFFFFFFFFNFFLDNLVVFIFTFELMVVPVCMMMVYSSYGEDKIESSFLMIFMNLISSIPFILGSIIYFNTLGSFNFTFFKNLYLDFSCFIYIFMILVLLFKLPVFFMHFWLPKAHVSASGACSMVLAGVMIKMSSIALYKFGFMVFMCHHINFVVSFFTFLGLFFCSLIIFRSTFDFKIFVAYSSILHMSPIWFCFNESLLISDSCSFMISIFHGIVSPILFYFITIFYEKSHNRSFFFLKSSTFNSYLFLVFYLLMNFGFPPFMGFLLEILLGVSFLKLSYMLLFSFLFSFILCFISMFAIICNVTLSSFNFIYFHDSYYLTSINYIYGMLIMAFYSVMF